MDNAQSIRERLVRAQVASCDCMTKTPEYQHHAEDCTYRLLEEARMKISELETASCKWAFRAGIALGHRGRLIEALRTYLNAPITQQSVEGILKVIERHDEHFRKDMELWNDEPKEKDEEKEEDN